MTPEKVANGNRCTPQLLPLTSDKKATPVIANNKRAKQKKRAELITVGPVQGTSRQVKNNNTLQKFIKSPKTTAGCDKTSESSKKDSSKCESKANVSTKKTKDEECIVLSDWFYI